MKKHMIHINRVTRSFLVGALIGSQLLSGTPSFASTSAPTPEFHLFETLTALQGEKLGRSELQAKMNQALTEYQSVAQTDGMQERTREALIDLGMVTPARAQSIVATVNAESAKNQDFSTLVNKVAGLQTGGAQFSACARDYLILAGVVAVGGTLVGLQFTSLGQPQTKNYTTTENDTYIWAGFATLIIGAYIVSDSISGDCDN